MTTNNPKNKKKKQLILGQDPNILMALVANIISWFVHQFLPSKYLLYLLPTIPQQQLDDNDEKHDVNTNDDGTDLTECIVIGRPGGIEQLRRIKLKSGIATCGYNMSLTQDIPFTRPIHSITDIPNDCVVVQIHTISVNYADCTIRWGLYESANEFVGYPIVPGFDFAGIVELSSSTEYKPGDAIYGCTLFGSYSTRVLVPVKQIQKIPTTNPSSSPSSKSLLLSMTEAASIPAVALTSLYALFLAGQYHPYVPVVVEPTTSKTNKKFLFSNNSILIHSAAGGVGSMLVQMSKLLGLSPIVGVVGNSSKINAAKQLGCDIVIDKSQFGDNNKDAMWDAIADANPEHNGKYAAIMDPNGVDSLQYSYNALGATGRLIVFGFHTNLPMGAAALNPIQWIKMGIRMSHMPKFDPMDMTTSNKSVLAFNLSFFDKEIDVVVQLFNQISLWLINGQLQCPHIVTMPFDKVADAHDLIQSGKTIGKLVLTTKYHNETA